MKTKYMQRITKVKPFKNKYKWEEINFPSEKDDWKKNGRNYVTIAFNLFFGKEEKLYPA